MASKRTHLQTIGKAPYPLITFIFLLSHVTPHYLTHVSLHTCALISPHYLTSLHISLLTACLTIYTFISFYSTV